MGSHQLSLIKILYRCTTCNSLIYTNAGAGTRVTADALRAGAQVVVRGRVADPSLTVGPAMAYFNWSETDWDTLGRATMAGRLPVVIAAFVFEASGLR